VQEDDGRGERGRQEVSTLRVLTLFSTAFQKSGRVPDFFCFSKAIRFAQD
jgi:hypothetical protein